jgi:hypothetical protein
VVNRTWRSTAGAVKAVASIKAANGCVKPATQASPPNTQPGALTRPVLSPRTQIPRGPRLPWKR